MEMFFKEYVNFKKYVKDGNFLDLTNKTWISNYPDNLKELVLFLGNNPNITALSLKNCDIDSAKFELLMPSIKKSISKLDISSNILGDMGAAKVGELSNLTDLNMACTGLSTKALSKLGELPNLVVLNLSCNSLGTKFIFQIDELTKLAKLNELSELSKLSKLTKFTIACCNLDFPEIEKLSNLSSCHIIFGKDTEDELVKLMQDANNPNINLTHERVENMVFKLVPSYNFDIFIRMVINSPEKYPFAINSRDDEGHSLLSFYNHNPEMQQFLFQHGAVPDTEQKQDRLKTLAQDNQSVHTTEAVKLVNFITDNLFKAYGNIENEQQLLAKAESYHAELTKLDQVYQNSIKLKLLSLSDGAKRDTMKKTLVANQPTPSDQDYVATVIEKAKIALTTIYLGKTNGHYNQGYPTHKMEYGDGHKITIPQSLGLVKALIDTMEIPVAEKLELLVTLMRKNPELVKSKLKIIQDKLNIDVPPTILVDSTKCHKFLASNPVIKKTPQIIGDLFNSISDLDIDQTWREQKAFTVAEAIYVAATTYNAADGANRSIMVPIFWTEK